MTAYEVLISDWSSDVCSSDLVLTDDEFGIKFQGGNGDVRFRTAFAAYHAKYDDIQRNLVVAVGTPPTPSRVLLNAASARINGAEFEGTLIFSDLLELSGFVGYTDAKFIAYIDPQKIGRAHV